MEIASNINNKDLHKQFAQSDEIFWKISHVSSSIKLEFMILEAIFYQTSCKVFNYVKYFRRDCRGEKRISLFIVFKLNQLEVYWRIVWEVLSS